MFTELIVKVQSWCFSFFAFNASYCSCLCKLSFVVSMILSENFSQKFRNWANRRKTENFRSLRRPALKSSYSCVQCKLGLLPPRFMKTLSSQKKRERAKHSRRCFCDEGEAERLFSGTCISWQRGKIAFKFENRLTSLWNANCFIIALNLIDSIWSIARIVLSTTKACVTLFYC